MKNKFFGQLKILAVFATGFIAVTASAEVGVTDTEISVGSSLVLSGPTEGLGKGVRAGYETLINKVNKQGINGRKIKLVIKDDEYEPQLTGKNTKELIETEKVFSLFSYIGTPTTNAATSVLNGTGVTLLGMFTGAQAFREPVNPQLYHIRASYFAETERLVSHFVEKGKKKIGIFIQSDGYGTAGKDGVAKALTARGLDFAGQGSYARNTVAIENGLARLLESKPEVVICVGTYKACAAFLKAAHAKNFSPEFATISFVGTSNLVKEIGADGEGTIISQVLPNPWLSTTALVKEYQADMKASGQADFDYTSLEGYVNAKVLIEALTIAGKDLTRASFNKALSSINKDFGGFKIDFSKGQQGSSQVFLTKIQGGKVVDL